MRAALLSVCAILAIALPAASIDAESPSLPGGWVAAAEKLKLTDLSVAKGAWSYTTNHYDNVASFTLRNDNPFPIKDVGIKCWFYAPSGTDIGSTIGRVYEIIPAQGQKKIDEFDLGRPPPQWQKARCTFLDFELVP